MQCIRMNHHFFFKEMLDFIAGDVMHGARQLRVSQLSHHVDSFVRARRFCKIGDIKYLRDWAH